MASSPGMWVTTLSPRSEPTARLSLPKPRLPPTRADYGFTPWAPNGTPLELPPGSTEILAFYRDDYVLVLDGDSKPIGWRGNFVRDAGGQVQWFRIGGRLGRKVS